MFKTTKMKLIELMILRQDIDRVLEYLGKTANFQIQNETELPADSAHNPHRAMFDQLQSCRSFLKLPDVSSWSEDSSLPGDSDYASAQDILAAVEDMRRRENEAGDRQKRIRSAWDEAKAFANLKVAYSELEHLTFLSMRIGKIDPSIFEELRFSVGDRAVIVSLGADNSRILAAASKKGRFALDSELKKFGFIALEVPKDFKGVPDDVLEGLQKQSEEADRELADLSAQRDRYADAHAEQLRRLLESFSLGAQVSRIRESLEATQLVYRIMGWIAASDCSQVMRDLDNLTEGRIAIRTYEPGEVPSVKNGHEKVPVQYRHNAFVKSFERMIFSYGAPLYGTVDPTPVVAFFFTLLFGIMFGDVGQGLVFFLIGLLMISKKAKVLKNWNNFGPIFVAIGCSSMVMGLLTGEFFANSEVLRPFSRFVTGLFGEPRDHILHMMPSKDSLGKLIVFFGFTVAVGFIINSVGLIINIVNQFSLGKPAHAVFSKTGVCGAFFFWYVASFVIRVLLGGVGFSWFDIVGIAIPLIGIFFAEPFTRLFEGHRPVFENGLFSAVIEGIVEILEVVSTYISNSVSFLRVGAFALSHAVLSFIIFTMSDLVGGSLSAGGIAIGIFGNAIIIILEGLIVAIQVIRLQYYEFFSKFFTETGREFKPFRFKYTD
ncbi:MAG: ATPase [Spirochaetales bacterium]|nr:ATPase [Spirochaetales bacterium]